MSNEKPNQALSLLRVSRWVLSYGRRRWRQLAALLALMLLGVGLNILRPWPMVFLVDYVLKGRAMPETVARFVEVLPGAPTQFNLIGWGVVATVVIFLLGWAAGLATSYGNVSFGQRLVYDLASDLVARLQQLSLRFHAGKSVGDNIRRVTSDCGCVSIILKDALIPALSSVVTLVAMFSILWRIDAELTLLALAVVPVMGLAFRLCARPMLERGYTQQESEGRIYDLVEQSFAAIPVVQAFGREEFNDRRFAQACRDTLAATLTLTRVQVQFRILVGLAAAVGTAAILWLGAQHALAGHLSVGHILLFLAYLGSLYGPLEAIMYSTSTIQGAAGSARRVLEVLETEREVADKRGALALASVIGRVQIENVTFGYKRDRPVLHDVSLEARPGEIIAVVGATGSGKTTLLSLIPRFFDPWAGRVLIDGHDVRDLQLKALRSQVALVLQEPFLFPRSLAENIAYGRPDATRAAIEAAARAANIHDFIQRLPAGYQTIIGERGATLSGGERQRLSIARAILKNAPILILDEPTSALDAETENSILEALERLMQDRTTFIIAHRLSTVRRATRIVVLDKGAVAEAGTHQELLACQGLYFDLYRRQFSNRSNAR